LTYITRDWYEFTRHIRVITRPHATMIVGTESVLMTSENKADLSLLQRDGLNSLSAMFLQKQ
jgi:hypothetical protein